MKFVLVSHGALAQGMLNSISMFLGPQDELVALCLEPTMTPDTFTQLVKEQLSATNPTVVFSDVFSGTPFNCVVALSQDYDIYHVCGMNLAMVIEAVVERNAGGSAQSICDAALAAAALAVKDVRALLQQDAKTPGQTTYEEDF